LTSPIPNELPARRYPEGPFSSRFWRAGKKRPVVVVQADAYNQRLQHAVVAQISTNLAEKDDPAYLFIDSLSAEAKSAGLDRDCLICGTLLALMSADRLQEKIGSLPATTLARLDGCLRAALGLS
jgi:mRNA interferase MazF